MTYQNLILLVGAAFLVIGIVAIVKTQWAELTVSGVVRRMAFGTIGLAMMVASYFVPERPPQPTAPAENKAASLSLVPPQPRPGEQSPTPEQAAAALTSKADPEKLLGIIEREQAARVKKSYNDFDCFTEVDLARFKSAQTPDDVAKKLERNGEFIDVVVAIRGLDNTTRQSLLERAAARYKQTWREMGGKGPKGQTDAGQEAERLIAEKVVEKVKELVKKPDAELRKLAP